MDQQILDAFINAVATEVMRRIEVERVAAAVVAPVADPPLEETLSRMLQQAAWFKTMVGSLLDDMDFRQEIEQVVRKFDFDDDIDRGLKRHDFSDAIEKAVDDVDLDPLIKDYIERRVTVSIEFKN